MPPPPLADKLDMVLTILYLFYLRNSYGWHPPNQNPGYAPASGSAEIWQFSVQLSMALLEALPVTGIAGMHIASGIKSVHKFFLIISHFLTSQMPLPLYLIRLIKYIMHAITQRKSTHEMIFNSNCATCTDRYTAVTYTCPLSLRPLNAIISLFSLSHSLQAWHRGMHAIVTSIVTQHTHAR